MGDIRSTSLSPSSSSRTRTDNAASESSELYEFTTPHTLLLAIPSNPRLHTVVSYWAPSTTTSPLPQCYHAHTRLTYDQVRRLKHCTDHGTVTIPNIGFDLASYLQLQVFTLKISSEDDGFVPALVEHLELPAGEERDAVVRKRDMQVQIMSVRVLGSKAGEKSMLDVVYDGDGSSLVWKWKVGCEAGCWEKDLEKAFLVAGKRARGEDGMEILVKGKDEVDEK